MIYSGPPLAAPVDLVNVLATGLESGPDDLALVALDKRWTWRQLDETSRRLARAYLGLGLVPGDRLASLVPHTTDLVVHYLACIRAGLVTVPINYRSVPREIDYVLGITEPSAMLVHAGRAENVAASEKSGELPLGLIVHGGVIGDAPQFERLPSDPDAAADLPAPDYDAPAFIYFTSGTTGRPKGVTHSLRTFGWHIASLAQSRQIRSEDIVLPATSMSHSTAFKIALTAFSVGARVAVARRFDPGEILALLREHRPTVLGMLPAALTTLLRSDEAEPDDFKSVRRWLSGGDKVSEEARKAMADLAGASIFEGFGMTEVGIPLCSPPSEASKPGSVGVLNPGYEAAIRDHDGTELPDGAEGCLWIRGPGNMLRYWGDPEITAATLVNGWIDTDDLMRVDADGYFWFRGRRKQIIVHNGLNIAPQEVEDAVMCHPAVNQAAAVGVPDPVYGENVWAFISLKDGVPPPSSEDVMALARDRIGYKAPETVIVVDDLPHTASGKLDRAALKAMAVDLDAARPGP